MNKIIIYVEILKKTKGEKKILELIVSLAKLGIWANSCKNL